MRLAVALVFVVACGGGSGGGGSGLPPDKAFVDLSPAEVMQLCQSLIDGAPPTRTVDCPTGGPQVVDPGTVGECVADHTNEQTSLSSCGLTEGQIEACDEALIHRTDAEVCNDESIPEACVPVFSCG